MYLKHLADTSDSSSLDGYNALGEASHNRTTQHLHPAANVAFIQLIRIQSAYLPGYNLAIASSIRDGPIRNLAPAFAQLGRQTKKLRKEHGIDQAKVLLVWVTVPQLFRGFPL